MSAETPPPFMEAFVGLGGRWLFLARPRYQGDPPTAYGPFFNPDVAKSWGQDMGLFGRVVLIRMPPDPPAPRASED